MDLIEFAVALSALLCSLVAGLVFTFAVVVMPGIQDMGGLDFLRSFKAMDRVIQDSSPLFILVWLGSAVVLLGATILGVWQLQGLDRVLLITACAIYFLGVQLPTITINIPLNNRLQAADLDAMTEAGVTETVALFESRWLRWNAIRTVLAVVTASLLLALLVRL